MATFDDSYSRMVSWLKFALPLLALIILSTLFLFARKFDPEQAIPYANVDVGQMVREQRIKAPTFSGVTRDGSAMFISAETVRPEAGTPDRMTGDTIFGRIDMPNGATAEISAAAGVIDPAEDQARLGGGVRFATSTGYTVETEGLVAALNRTEVISDGPVTGSGPAGTLNAGAMQLSVNDEGGYVLVFNEGVRLVYDPRQDKE